MIFLTTSFKVLYTTYYKKVYSTCLLILKNHHLAEESTQEAFIKAYRNIDKLKDPTKFGVWIASIASNCAINIYKENKNNNVVNIEDVEVMDYLLSQRINRYNTPYDELEKLELNKEMKIAISKLKPPLNQLIILKYYWELTDQEISEMLDMPLGTVKSSLYRARKILSRVLPSINKDYLKMIKGENNE